MIANIRRAETETGRSCRILMDLAGHKIRTGPVALEPPIHHIKVKKDRTGKVIANGYLVLTTETSQSAENGNLFKVPVCTELHKKLAPGMLLEFLDNQNKQRFLKIEKALSSYEWLASCEKDAYLLSGCQIKLHKPDQNTHNKRLETFYLGKFAGEPVKIRVEKDDRLLLTDEKIQGKSAQYSSSGVLVHSAHIGCTLASALSQLETGQPVWLDDGKIGAVVEQLSDQGALLRITVAKPGGVSIKSDRGINFPETDLKLPPLSEKDLADLDFVCAHADLIGFSFVETLADMDLLMAELAKRNASEIPIIAKIETNKAVKNLPDIVLGSMGRHKLGIMIARGDLAVELGSARLAEIQEELLWLCEAAHVPVIWATQVLESIAKKGTRSRPEFTDAAMAVRAECVMLNKGPFILDAIEALVNVMVRMHEHQRKKFSRLRALHW
jgi:pyruvate kinase